MGSLLIPWIHLALIRTFSEALLQRPLERGLPACREEVGELSCLLVGGEQRDDISDKN
uniref:Uncharacterized protein n=1 Tax=Arundo donax TaxID=35708 RepID=A0A0A9ESX0_ARUDO